MYLPDFLIRVLQRLFLHRTAIFPICLTALTFIALLTVTVIPRAWAQDDPIGVAVVTVGEVFAISSAGISRTLSRRSNVFALDTIDTGEDGYIQLRMNDSAQISLRPNTRFVLDAYEYDAADSTAGNASMRLLEGGFRTVSGLLDRDMVEYETPFATIGVRGTMHDAFISPDDGALYTGVYDGGTFVTNAQGFLELGLGADYDFSRTFPGEAPVGLLQLPLALQNATALIRPAAVNNAAATAVQALNAAVDAINNNAPDAGQDFVAAVGETAGVASAFLASLGIDDGSLLESTATGLAAQLNADSLQTIATLLSTESAQSVMNNLQVAINPQQNSAEVLQLKGDELTPGQLTLLGGFLNQGIANVDSLIDETGQIDLEQTLAEPENLAILLELMDVAFALVPEGGASANPASGLSSLDPTVLLAALQSQVTTADISSLLVTRTGIINSPLASLPDHRAIILNARSAAGSTPAIAALNTTPAPAPIASWGYWDQDSLFPNTSGLLPSLFKKGFLAAIISTADPALLADLEGDFRYATDATNALLAGTATSGDITDVTMEFTVNFTSGRVHNGFFSAEVNQGQESWSTGFAGQVTGSSASLSLTGDASVQRAGLPMVPMSGNLGGVFTGTANTPDFVGSFSLADPSGNGISGLTLLRAGQ